MRLFSLYNQFLYVLLITGVLAGCIPSTIPPTVSAAPVAASSIEPTQLPPLATLQSTSTPMPFTRPQSTTNGFYATLHHTSISSDVFQIFWKDNYCIISLAYGDGLWATTLDRHETCGNQSIVVGRDFPEREVKQASADGYFITGLAYGNGQWAVVLSQADFISAQQLKTYSTFPPDDDLDMQRKGYWVTDVVYRSESWTVVFSKDRRISGQKFEFSSTFPWDDIKQAAANHMFLTSEAYGSNSWAIVLSNESMLEQDIGTQSFFSKDIVLPYWEDEKHYYEMDLFYGENTWFVVANKELP